MQLETVENGLPEAYTLASRISASVCGLILRTHQVLPMQLVPKPNIAP